MPIDIPLRFDDQPLLWTVEDVYSEDECAAFIDRIEGSLPTEATSNLYRNHDRVVVDDDAVAEDLFRRLQVHLPARIGPLTLEGLNSRIRMFRYRPGQSFVPHMDNWYRFDDVRITLLTVIVYFNANFVGGETRFMQQIEDTVYPRPGLVAVFQHTVAHEGCPVLSGTKYAMRSDAVYRASEAIGRVGLEILT